MTTATDHVMLVGGGRWARQHARVLTSLLPAHARLTWVSAHHAADVAAFAASIARGVPISLVQSLDQGIAARPQAAIVATATHTHASIARVLLEHDIHTLVEKPLALVPADADALTDIAARRGLVLGTGLLLQFATYLHHFTSLWHGRQAVRLHMEWFDPEAETRYGETKRMDPTTDRMHDLVPHLWSILRVLLPDARPVLTDVFPTARGGATLLWQAGSTRIEAAIGRRAPARRRWIEVVFDDGGSAALDFSIEPGVPRIDGHAADTDPAWGRTPTPLSAEVASFLALAVVPRRSSTWPCIAALTNEAVIAAASASAKLRSREAATLRERLKQVHDHEKDEQVRALLVDNLAPELAAGGIRVQAIEAQALLVRAALVELGHVPHAAEAGLALPAELRSAVQASAFLRHVASRA